MGGYREVMKLLKRKRVRKSRPLLVICRFVHGVPVLTPDCAMAQPFSVSFGHLDAQPCGLDDP